MVFKNYYKILDLETSRVSIDEVKQAYRLAAKKHHPDLNVGNTIAEEKIKDINEAYKILSNPSSKRKYDRIWNSNFEKGKKAFSTKNEKNVFFKMFLGDIEDNKEKVKQERGKKPIKGDNIETEISVKIEEAFYGLEKQISFKDAEEKQRTILVKIPEGIRNNEKIRLIGMGKVGKYGGRNGDLFLKVKIKDNNNFKLKGKNIYTELPLTPWEAVLGTKANVKAIDDEVKVYIPKGIQSGEEIIIPNKGYKGVNKDERGNLIAKIKIVVPTKLTKEEETIYRKLSNVSKFAPRNNI